MIAQAIEKYDSALRMQNYNYEECARLISSHVTAWNHDDGIGNVISASVSGLDLDILSRVVQIRKMSYVQIRKMSYGH